MRVTIALCLAGGLVLAACSPSEPAETATTATTATVPAGPQTLDEASRAGPEPFVRALYARYDDGAMPAPVPPGQNPIFSRKLNAMIGADDRQGTGALTNDPVCDCQGGTIALQQVTITETGQNLAEAALTLTRDGVAHQQTLKLIKEGPAWRVEDVVVPGREPLTTTLLAAIS